MTLAERLRAKRAAENSKPQEAAGKAASKAPRSSQTHSEDTRYKLADEIAQIRIHTDKLAALLNKLYEEG